MLEQVGLPALIDRLAEERPWALTLSLGEQQRLAFARAFLQRPEWLFLDEASSALDEAAEANLYGELIRQLPRTGIISVGHRTSLLAFHERRFRLEGGGAWRVEEISAGTRDLGAR